ncbi:zinc finger, CCHC-type containing protein [Tanacetum coccineum]
MRILKFYVIEPNEFVSINSIIESRDAIFYENRFSSIPRPNQRSLINGTDDSGVLEVLDKVSEEVVVQQPELRKRKRTPKTFGPKFQLYLIKGTRLQMDIQKKDEGLVDLTKELLSSRFSMKDMGEVDVFLGVRIKHEINEILIFQSHYIEKVLKKFNYFDYTPTSTPMNTSDNVRPNNVWKLSRYPSLLEGYTNASWINNTEDNSSTSGSVFLLGEGAISWASK